MADRPLDLVLNCEKYDDGSSFTISYAEERSDPEFNEQNSPEGSGATRCFYCKWEDRFAFQENMFGFAKINPGNTDGINGTFPDATGFNGRHIHRRLPVGYHNGKVSTATPPAPQDWVYATRATVFPDGGKMNETPAVTMTEYRPKAVYAKIIMGFAALDYDLYSDLQVYNGNGTAGVAANCCREWLRYGRIIQKPASIFYRNDFQYLKLVDYPKDGKEGNALGSIDYNKHPAVLDNIADFWVYLYDLPYDPIAAVNLCFGMVNSTDIFPTPDFTEGQPKESLHLVSVDITRLPLRMSRRYWNLQLGFRKVFNRDNSPLGAGAVVGHNYQRFVVKDAGNVLRLRLYRCCSDPANPQATDSAMINLVDFRKLFWIPTSCIQPPALPAGP